MISKNEDKNLTLGQIQEKKGKENTQNMRNLLNMTTNTCAVLVKNLEKTSDDKAPDGLAWFKYWMEKTNSKKRTCSNIKCNNSGNLEGAHVQKVNSTDRDYYIVPLCKECNNHNNVEPFKVKAKFVLVPND